MCISILISPAYVLLKFADIRWMRPFEDTFVFRLSDYNERQQVMAQTGHTRRHGENT